MRDFKPPAQTLPRPIEELDQWLRACKGGPPSDASFENAYPFAEGFARIRGDLSTCRKQGHNPWEACHRLALGQPFMPRVAPSGP